MQYLQFLHRSLWLLQFLCYFCMLQQNVYKRIWPIIEDRISTKRHNKNNAFPHIISRLISINPDIKWNNWRPSYKLYQFYVQHVMYTISQLTKNVTSIIIVFQNENVTSIDSIISFRVYRIAVIAVLYSWTSEQF